jgi:hypothetical protein
MSYGQGSVILRQKSPASSPVTAGARNGLTITSGYVELGGTLIQSTNIESAGYTFAVGDLSGLGDHGAYLKLSDSTQEIVFSLDNGYRFLIDTSSNTYKFGDIDGVLNSSKIVIDDSTANKSITNTAATKHIWQVGTAGATEAMRINETGRVGIGNNAPTALLDVKGVGSSPAMIRAISTSGRANLVLDTISGITNGPIITFRKEGVDHFSFYEYNGASNKFAVYEDAIGNDAFSIYNGNTTIGSTTGGNKLNVNGNVGIGTGTAAPSNGAIISGTTLINTTVDSGYKLDISGSLRATTSAYLATTSGSVGIGTISPSAQLHTTSTVRFANFGAGTATFDASGNLSSVSDERLKDVQGGYNGGLDEIHHIVPIVYKWNVQSGNETEHNYIGFSAQNIQEALGEEAIGVGKDGYLSIQDRAIIATLVNAVQTLANKIDYLENQLNILN